MLVFSLPSNRASERVRIWRKLQKYGTLALRNSGYVLPNTQVNQERLEWLATAIRGFKGEASVLEVLAIDDPPSDRLKERFREERKPDYTALIQEVQQLKASTQGFSTQLVRLKRRFDEIAEIDFFESPLRAKTEEAIYKAEHPVTPHERARIEIVLGSHVRGQGLIASPLPGSSSDSSIPKPPSSLTTIRGLTLMLYRSTCIRPVASVMRGRNAHLKLFVFTLVLRTRRCD